MMEFGRIKATQGDKKTLDSLKSLRKFLGKERHRLRLQGLSLSRKLQRSRQLVILGAAHKTGTTWYGGLLKNICGLQMLSLPSNLTISQLSPDIDLIEVLEKTQVPYGSYFYRTHTLPLSQEFVHQYDYVKFLTILRDPRDVIVSASFDLANRPEEKGGWGPEFKTLPETQRILHLIENADRLIALLRGWGNCPYAYKIRYEDLHDNGVDELKRAIQYLGYTVRLDTIRRYYRNSSFEKASGRMQGVEDKVSFYRKGIIGDWREKFNSECIHAFKTWRNGEWQDLLVRLGYEIDENW